MSSSLSAFLKQPLRIGSKTIENRLLLAPMAGLTHIAFRELVAGFGGHGLLFTEMCNARLVPHENRFVSPVFRWRDQELPFLVCQLFGSDPMQMAKAAARVEREGFFGVDINMGCAVTGICRQNCGAELLKQPELAARIVEAVRKTVSIPVFVKFRTGWSDDPEYAVMLAKLFQAAGADALTFHPRMAPDRRSRPPKWDYIRLVKENVGIPVFGNGNVFDEQDARTMLTSTGCEGIALGRIAAAKPWIFRAWTEDQALPKDIFSSTLLKLTHLLETHFEPSYAAKLFRKFVPYFSSNFRFGHDLRRRLWREESMAAVRLTIQQEFEKAPELTTRPNINLFCA